MRRSTERILTTHAGSLPRPDDLFAMIEDREQGKPIDRGAYDARVRGAVAEIVRKQLALGLDIIDDGEQSKPGFVTYVNERLSGIEQAGPRANPWAASRETESFPEFYAEAAQRGGSVRSVQMVCTGPIRYQGMTQLQTDIANFKAALAGLSIVEAFMPAISPTNVEGWQRNAYYKTDEDYLFAIADAMHEEYQGIVDAGFLLQIDDPRLVTYYILQPRLSLAECRKWAEVRVEALNHALRGIPPEKVRYHTCYSINMGPRVHDMALRDIVDILLKIRAGAYSFEAANPRHEHEWRVWESVKLGEDKILIPGVITHTSVLVEHPELVAERIQRFAAVVGRERVIAGADCGFATFAGSHEIHPSIAWAKLQALTQGARLASAELWPRR
jgi:5-methyltetrahydropteroyltriglutamate--homocysteine methyltransferase